jgi:hypothetical protein
MVMPDGMYPATPPPVSTGDRGKKPSLLTDEKAQVLLANPNTWYVIGESSKWISGVKHNIESMQQTNIAHLAAVGRFAVKQRKNKDTNMIDIYCQFITKDNEEE